MQGRKRMNCKRGQGQSTKQGKKEGAGQGLLQRLRQRTGFGLRSGSYRKAALHGKKRGMQSKMQAN